MAKTEKSVLLKIESRTHGHESLRLPVSQAVEEVGKQTGENGKWLYVDGDFISVNVTTKEGKENLSRTLASARDVVLAGGLLGG